MPFSFFEDSLFFNYMHGGKEAAADSVMTRITHRVSAGSWILFKSNACLKFARKSAMGIGLLGLNIFVVFVLVNSSCTW